MKKILALVTVWASLCAFPSLSGAAEVTLNITNHCTYQVGIARAASLESNASQNYDADGWQNLDAGKSVTIDMSTQNYPYLWLNIISNQDDHYLTRTDASLCGHFLQSFYIMRQLNPQTGAVEFSATIGANAEEKRGTTCEAVGGEMLPGWEKLNVTGGTLNYSITHCQ